MAQITYLSRQDSLNSYLQTYIHIHITIIVHSQRHRCIIWYSAILTFHLIGLCASVKWCKVKFETRRRRVIEKICAPNATISLTLRYLVHTLMQMSYHKLNHHHNAEPLSKHGSDTLLSRACTKGNIFLIDYLVKEKGCDPAGESCMCAEWLFQLCCFNQGSVNPTGDTMWSIANSLGLSDVLRYLESLGAGKKGECHRISKSVYLLYIGVSQNSCINIDPPEAWRSEYRSEQSIYTCTLHILYGHVALHDSMHMACFKLTP